MEKKVLNFRDGNTASTTRSHDHFPFCHVSEYIKEYFGLSLTPHIGSTSSGIQNKRTPS